MNITRDTIGFTQTATLDAGSVTPSAPVATEGGAGNVNNGTHSWKITFVGPGGSESLPSVASNVVDVLGPSEVLLTAVPLGPAGTVARKVYRTVAGNGGNYKLVGTIADNAAVGFTDNVADDDLGANAPSASTWLFLLFQPFDLLRYDKKCFTLKNAGGQPLNAAKLQVAAADAPGESDWEDLDTTTWATLAAGAVKSKQFASDSHRFWRVVASVASGATTVSTHLTAGAV